MNEFLQSEIMQKLRSVQKSQALLQLRMNNEAQLVCFWCCAPPGFVVQINNFSSLVLFSAVIHKRRGKKLISKTIQYKLDSSSRMQIACFILSWKHLIFFSKNYRFCRKSGNAASNRGRGNGHVVCVIMSQCVQKSIYHNRKVIKVSRMIIKLKTKIIKW